MAHRVFTVKTLMNWLKKNSKSRTVLVMMAGNARLIHAMETENANPRRFLVAWKTRKRFAATTNAFW
jgi:hypothetical protein